MMPSASPERQATSDACLPLAEHVHSQATLPPLKGEKDRWKEEGRKKSSREAWMDRQKNVAAALNVALLKFQTW